jgi:hypothetical protein
VTEEAEEPPRAAIALDPGGASRPVATAKYAKGRAGDASEEPGEALAILPKGGASALRPDEQPTTEDDALSRRVVAPNPRRVLLVHLAEDLREAIVAGDIEAARVAHEAIGRLLGSDATQLAPVVDLDRQRGAPGGHR